jgi:hypothetical protein
MLKTRKTIIIIIAVLAVLSVAYAQNPDFSVSLLERKFSDYVDNIRTIGYAFAAFLATLGFLIRGVSKMIPETQYRSMATVWSTEMIVTAAVITAGVILAPLLVELVKELFGA